MKKDVLTAWFFLIGAIIFEVTGTSFLKTDNKILGYIVMMFCISFSYVFLAKAMRKIQIGIAYAVWELLGSILIITVSFVLFNEHLTDQQMIGIALAFIGIILINIGEVKEK